MVAAVRDAFATADQGGAVMPWPLELRLPDVDGELHVKGAYIEGAQVFAVKTATPAEPGRAIVSHWLRSRT
jgi:ornithine cyclodeaminase/alanine dehydrogenase-like protein (mu-crystallin family)